MKLTYRSTLPERSPEEVFAWHQRPGALERLTPPWVDARVVRRRGGIEEGGEVELEIRKGPTRVGWHLRHTDFLEGRQFTDEQVAGPMKRWRHIHRFRPDETGGTVLEDEIEMEPPLGVAGETVLPSMVERELDRLFAFRYRRLAEDLARHAEHVGGPRLTVAISGASGLIGSNLAHFLTTGGHRVIRLVRREEEVEEGTVYWNPSEGEIDREGLARADAVVHLAGAPVAPGRWSEARKRSILESRVHGTRLLAEALAEMNEGPRTLVSASGVHFYGSRGTELLREGASTGEGFMAEVCRQWEAAARPAERTGVRVVRLRTGMVLSPAGGALGQMLLPFKLGVGGRLGTGSQYMSWIDLDDHVAAIVHALHDEGLSGPVNATAPNPVTNATFTSTLGRVLGRPTFIPVPALALKAAFGEMAEELLLHGQRVLPGKLSERGFRFAFEGLEESLRFQLGRGTER
ncbi:MAG: TIGR01777 family oxidoreductase [Gemmatimonadota bacterium]|nr:TIGR01777 family oxidoreductase [Gemmatimonadota bacterium]